MIVLDITAQRSAGWVIGTGPLGWIAAILMLAVGAAFHVLVARPKSTFSPGRWTIAWSVPITMALIAIGRAEYASPGEWIVTIALGALFILFMYVGMTLQNEFHRRR